MFPTFFTFECFSLVRFLVIPQDGFGKKLFPAIQALIRLDSRVHRRVVVHFMFRPEKLSTLLTLETFLLSTFVLVGRFVIV